MKKLLLLLGLLTSVCFASEFTPNYNLEIPAIGDRNWQSVISKDIISIDSVLKTISEDIPPTIVSSVSEGVASPLIINPTTGAVVVTMLSADETQAGYIDTTQYKKINILSSDVNSLITKTTILSNDATLQNTKLDILSNDATIQDNKLNIISNDVGSLKVSTSILSNDAIIQDNKLSILSNDSAWTKRNNDVFLITGTNNVNIGGTSPPSNATTLYILPQIGDVLGVSIDSAISGMGTVFSVKDSQQSGILVHFIGDSDGDAGGIYNTVFTKDGKFGVNTTSPREKFDVIGNGVIAGTLSVDSTITSLTNTIISNDVLALKTKTTIISNDSAVQDVKLSILSNDSAIQDIKLSILSNDTVTQNTKLNIISNDISVLTPKVSNLSSDVGLLKSPTYITQTSDGQLTNEQALGSLSSGIMRVATTTGVVTSLSDVLPIANGGTNSAVGYTTVSNDVGVLKTQIVNRVSTDAVLATCRSTTLSGDTLSVTGKYAFPTTVPSVNGSVISYDSSDNTLKWGTVAGGSGGGGATTALDNLASVAINTSLLSDTDNIDDLGSSSKTWKDVWAKGNILLGGTTVGTSGLGVIVMKENTPPTSSPADAIQLYAEGEDANTVLLFHADGADAATTYTAETGQTITFVDNAQLDTADKKFGASSLLLDGTNDCVTVPANATWNFDADFTIDFWAKFDALNATIMKSVTSDTYGSLANNDWLINVDGNGYLTFMVIGVGSASKTDVAIATGAWYHLAVTRSGTAINVFVNGAKGNNAVTSAVTIGNTKVLNIGLAESGITNSADGWIDEVRIIKGEAKWTATFTPPTAPYNIQTELRVRDEAGNITTLSPHNFKNIPESKMKQNEQDSDGLAWTYHSEKNGKEITVDMFRAVQLLEKLTGEQLIYTNEKAKVTNNIELSN